MGRVVWEENIHGDLPHSRCSNCRSLNRCCLGLDLSVHSSDPDNLVSVSVNLTIKWTGSSWSLHVHNVTNSQSSMACSPLRKWLLATPYALNLCQLMRTKVHLWKNYHYLLTVHTSNKLLRNALIFSREPRAPMKYVSSEFTILHRAEKRVRHISKSKGIHVHCSLLALKIQVAWIPISPMLCAAIVGDSETLQLYSEPVLEHLLNGRKERLHVYIATNSTRKWNGSSGRGTKHSASLPVAVCGVECQLDFRAVSRLVWWESWKRQKALEIWLPTEHQDKKQ